jgi:uncharacterized protein (TIGR02246 family)
MKRALLAATVAVWAQAAHATPRENIANLLHKQAEAWTRGDLEAFCSVYADDAVFISTSGMTKGRDSVLARYRKKYVDKSGMGALTLDVEEIRMLSDANASVVARWTLTWPDKPKAEGLTLLVLRKVQGRWLIVQDASM